MAASDDSDTAPGLDDSVPGVVSCTEAGDPSSQDDASSHETEAVVEETRDVETTDEAEKDYLLLPDPLPSSSALENGPSESVESLHESSDPTPPSERAESPPPTSNKPAELRPPLLPRLSTSLLARAQSRSSPTSSKEESISSSRAASSSPLGEVSALEKDHSQTRSSKPPSLEDLRNKFARKGSFEAQDKNEVVKEGGAHSQFDRLEETKKSSATPFEQNAANPPTVITTAPERPRPLPREYAPTYFPARFESGSGGWANPAPTPSVMPSAPRYPLEHRWTFYQQSPREVVANKKPAFQSHDRPAYESSLTELGEATSVESFARLFNPLKTPSKQEIGTSLYIFKDGIIPAWEHEANANGGKWSLLVKGDAALLDRSWLWLVLALVGEKLVEEAEICGAVLSIRPRDNRIQLWCRDKSRISQLNTLGRHVLNILELFFSTKGLHFEFFPHNAGSSSPSPVCFSINNPARPAKTTVELRRGSSFDGATSGLGALPEGVEGGLRIPKPSPLGFTVNSGSGWRKPAVELNEASVQAPSGGESDGRSTAGSTSRPTASTSRSAWW